MTTQIIYKDLAEATWGPHDPIYNGMMRKFDELDANIKSLNNTSARTYAEVKDTLKALNSGMLDFYPTIALSKEIGSKTIKTLKVAIYFLEIYKLLPANMVKQLARLGHNREKLQEGEKSVVDLKLELESHILALTDSIKKIGKLTSPFMVALNHALYVQSVDENTNTLTDPMSSPYSFAYLKKALNAQTPPKIENAP